MTAVMTPAAAHIRQGLRRNSRWRLRRCILSESGNKTARARPHCAAHVKTARTKPSVRQRRTHPASWPGRSKRWQARETRRHRNARTHWKTLRCRKARRTWNLRKRRSRRPHRASRQKLAYDRADSGYCADCGPDSGYCADCAYSGPYARDSADH